MIHPSTTTGKDHGMMSSTSVEYTYTISPRNFDDDEYFFEDENWGWQEVKEAFDSEAINKIKSCFNYYPAVQKRKLLFSKSGYLPARIKRIRK